MVLSKSVPKLFNVSQFLLAMNVNSPRNRETMVSPKRTLRLKNELLIFGTIGIKAPH